MNLGMKTSRHGALAATLALFLFGSNYCLVSAFAPATSERSGIDCHARAPAAEGAGSCCHPVADKTPAREPSGGSPCCMLLTSVSTIALDKLAPSAPMPAIIDLSLATAVVDLPTEAFTLDDSPPPAARHAGGPSSDRAPPRS
jgi:hypothetical protein